MSHIFYKFKSAKEYDTYRFEGAGVPVWELKKEIVLAKKLGKSSDFDLILTNAQTNEDYTDEIMVVPKNTQVIVRRVPLAPGKKSAVGYLQSQSGAATGGVGRTAYSSWRPPAPTKPNTSSNEAIPTEEEKGIRAMMQASGSHWEQNQQAMPTQQMGPRRYFRPANWRGPTQLGTPPPGYVCYRCGQKGHFIQNCPTNNDANFDRSKVRKTTGIPRSFLKPVAPPTEGTTVPSNFLVTPEGNLVIAAPNEQEWDRIASIRTLAESVRNIPAEEIPDSLKCGICAGLLNDAVVATCCDAAFCDECMRRALEEAIPGAGELAVGDTIRCPVCDRPGLSSEMIIPSLELRKQVAEFIENRNAQFLYVNDNEEQVDDKKEEEEEEGKDKQEEEKIKKKSDGFGGKQEGKIDLLDGKVEKNGIIPPPLPPMTSAKMPPLPFLPFFPPSGARPGMPPPPLPFPPSFMMPPPHLGPWNGSRPPPPISWNPGFRPNFHPIPPEQYLREENRKRRRSQSPSHD